MKSKLKVFTVASVILLGCTLFAHTAQAQTVKEFPQKFILIRNSGDGPELRAYFTVQVRLGRALEYCDVEIKNVELGFYGNYTYKGVMYNAPHPAFAGSNSLDVENLSSAAAQVTVRVSFGSNDTHTKKLNLTGLGNLFQIEKNNKNRDIDDWWESVSVDIPGEGSYKGRDYEAERAIQQWLKAEEQKKTDAEKAKAAAEKARADAIDKALADKHRAEKETEAAEKELNEAKRNGDKAAETEAQKKIDEAQALSKQSYDREMDAKYQSPEDFMKSNAENRDNRQEDNYSNRSSSSSSSNSSDPCAHYAEVLGKAMEAGDRELAAEYSKLMHQCYDRQRQRKERVEHQARYNKMTPKQKATDDVFRGLQTLTQRIADELIQQAEESDRREAAARIERERQAEIQRELERQHAALVNSRKNVLNRYKEGAFPTSSSKLSDEVWYFSYRFNNKTIENKQPTVYVTNAFPIARYKDGTFPLKRTVTEEITATGGTGNIIIVGSYTSQAEAERAQRAFIASLQTTDMEAIDLKYKRKISTDATPGKDFWGISSDKSNTKTQQTNKTTNGKNDFWNK